MVTRRRLAVIVPVHNERDNIAACYARLVAVLERLPALERWAIIFVNDGSTDESLQEILQLRASDERVKVISLARNFGYHAVLVAGLSSVDSDLYAIVDVDCEDPPELLEQFHRAMEDGYAVAYGIRSNRQEPPAILWLRRLFYRILQRVADAQIVEWMAEFAMFTRPVRQAILAPHTTYPFLRAEIGYVGFKRIGIPYLRAQRAHGQSHYNLYRMTKFAIGGILSSSTFPLRFVLYAAGVLAVAFPVAIAVFRLDAAGTAVLATVTGFYFLLLALPVISLYLARTHSNLIARPVFVRDDTNTFLEEFEAPPDSRAAGPEPPYLEQVR